MINLSPNELKFIPKSRGITDYKNKSEDNLINLLSEPKTTFFFSKIKQKILTKNLMNQDMSFLNKKKRDYKKSLWHKKNKKSF